MKTINRFIPQPIKTQLKNHFGRFLCGRHSYSQEGEDVVLHRLFDRSSNGFYIDIGCHHPFRFSNTYSFYRAGWKGLCIDPLPGVKRLFERHRPRDITLQMGVAETVCELRYYRFNEPALNTFDELLARERERTPGCFLVGVDTVLCDALARILESTIGRHHAPIDFMSVDVEGLDLQVLKSNDWTAYVPKVIVAECLGASLDRLMEHPITEFLRHHSYTPCSKLVHSVVFIHSDFIGP